MIISCILSYGIFTPLSRIVIQHGWFHIGKTLVSGLNSARCRIYKSSRRDRSVNLRHLESIPTRARASSKDLRSCTPLLQKTHPDRPFRNRSTACSAAFLYRPDQRKCPVPTQGLILILDLICLIEPRSSINGIFSLS